jgi:membrane fusion protein (multidrug efflux system)
MGATAPPHRLIGPLAAASFFALPAVPPILPHLMLAAALATTIGLAAIPVPGHAQTPAPATPAAPPVIVALSTEENDAVTLDVTGSGAARQSVTLFPAVAGEVAQVAFRTGQKVRANQVLFRLEDRAEKLAADLATARVEAASALARRYEGTRGTGAVPESVADEARAALRVAQIERQQANEAVADRVVRAPFAGVMGLANVERGDRVNTDTALTTIDDRLVLWIDFEVPEAYLGRIAIGQKIEARNPAHPGRAFAGSISEIDSRIDPVSRNVRVRATVPNTTDLLRPGMSFQVRLALPGKPFVSVPELALQWNREGPFVWVVREGNSVAVAARPVRRAAGRVLLDGDLKKGEQVVVEGVQRLREGRPVRVIGNGAAP